MVSKGWGIRGVGGTQGGAGVPINEHEVSLEDESVLRSSMVLSVPFCECVKHH